MVKQYIEFVEDATFQARAPRDDTNADKRLKWFREQWRAREYDKIIKALQRTPDDINACMYGSMALRAKGRVEESVIPILRGLGHIESKADRAKFYNQLAVRVYAISKDDELAELIASRAWRVFSDGRERGWNPILNQCEFKLMRARDGRADMAKTLKEIDILMGKLLDHFPHFEQDQEFINYIHRAVGIKEYRESNLWKRRFGHTKAR